MGVVNLPAARRGDVWLTRLDPTVGNEIRKTRPCLIVSPDAMNRFLGTVMVVPLTSGSSPARFRLPISFADRQGLLLGDQMRSVSKLRLVKQVGSFDEPTLLKALKLLQEIFQK